MTFQNLVVKLLQDLFACNRRTNKSLDNFIFHIQSIERLLTRKIKNKKTVDI